ncbi:AlpA family phage regulatory protein [Candidatus Synechococcus calcipolaris G9]|uniref:AlpA family phage regulatory protein n=1 Tax=Candidatus Synechococcus calcipolaris G9 TaxID=1497997 RepID=A0ABT6EXI4_9SYNE|nr:AlpA family phage regulatory protein [Candidatus Synechococcus calcipolaris]MDG2990511.1 AlpA family phage regulatory protein [Candidatus Synechococcus calcipolaris G9]
MSELPKDGFLRINDVLKFIPVGKSTWWAGIRAGKFPSGIKLGAKTTVWRVEDIRNLIENPTGGSLNAQKGTPTGANR